MALCSIVLCLLAIATIGCAQGDDRSLALGMVNQARAAQRVQPLSWSPDLVAYAQFWANEMGSGMQPFAHAPPLYRPHQGENLYVEESGQCSIAYDTPIQGAMHTWLAQAALYDGSPITTGHEPWLHWSQCMWSTTTQMGCARAFSITEAYKFFVVCRFAPQGNLVGQKPF